jgi:hypothetical protein
MNRCLRLCPTIDITTLMHHFDSLRVDRYTATTRRDPYHSELYISKSVHTRLSHMAV